MNNNTPQQPDRFDDFENRLKSHSHPPLPDFEKIEKKLFEQIQNHREYEQPIDECIAASHSLADAKWSGIEFNLDEKIQKVGALVNWEQILKSERVLPQGSWEKIEEDLFQQIEKSPSSGVTSVNTPALKGSSLKDIALNSLWLNIGFYFNHNRIKSTAFAAIFIGIFIATFFSKFQPSERMETLVYKAQGESIVAKLPGINSHEGKFFEGKIQGEENASLLLVNKRGFIEMVNGSGLSIVEATQQKMQVRLHFPEKKNLAKSSIVFFVNHKKGNDKYEVSTRDYRIEVVGTYFRVESDLDEHSSTTVMEGKIKIHSEAYGDFEVKSGEQLIFDKKNNTYKIQGGGKVFLRNEIDTLPSVDALNEYCMASIGSDLSEAQIQIDGKYRGATPLVILLPPGLHTVKLERAGSISIDTTISVSKKELNRLAFHLQSNENIGQANSLSKNSITKNNLGLNANSKSRKMTITNSANDKASGITNGKSDVDRLYQKADQIQESDWKSAFALYLQVSDSPSANPMQKQGALFSMAKLRADHEINKTQAKADFFKYLGLYPDGTFSGESWMRLAELEVGSDQNKAIEYYLHCIEKLPHHPKVSEWQHRIGLLYLQNHKYDQAVQMLQKSLSNILYARESDKKQIYESLYRAYVAKGDSQSAAAIEKQYRPRP